MKYSYFLIMALVCMCHNSCAPYVTEKPEHEIESINELMDSIAFRSNWGVSRNISCSKDTLYDSYHIITTAEDTMGIDTLDVDAWYKRLLANAHPQKEADEMRREVENHQFMIRNATQLVEKLCKTSKESYRFCNKDSVDYSVILNDNPKEFLNVMRWNLSGGRNEFYVSYHKREQVKVTAEPYNRKPVQKLLKKFLADYKNVQRYDVSFDWDEGIPFPSGYYEEIHSKFQLRYLTKNDKDSLAASHITGTHYVIPVADEKREEVIKDFTNRILRMTAEQPIPGSNLSLELKTKGKNKYYIMREYELRSPKIFRLPAYQIKIGTWEKNTVHILEIDSHDSHRYVMPHTWENVLRTHNTEIHYLNEVEAKPKPDTNFFQH